MRNRPMAVIFLTIFVDMLGFGILIPVIPNLFVTPTAKSFMLPSSIPLSSGYLLLGILLAIFPLAQFFSAPILGQLSDKLGRKKILAVSLGGTAISYLVFSLAILTKNIWLLFAARAVDGFTGGNVSVARAASADITPPEHRAKNFGLIGAAFGLGFIFGPYLGGKLSDPTLVPWFTESTPFLFAAALSFINTISVIFFFPETLKVKNTQKVIQWHTSLENIYRAVTMKGLRVMFATTFLSQVGFSFFTTFFGVFLMKKFMFNQSNVGDFLSYVGVWIVFTQMFLTRKTSKRFEEYQILKVTLLGTGLGILIYLFSSHSWQLFFIAPIFAICNGLSQSNLTALISRSAAKTSQGEIMGIASSVQALAQVLSPMAAGLLASGFNASSPILVSSLILIMSGIFFNYFFDPKKNYLFIDKV